VSLIILLQKIKLFFVKFLPVLTPENVITPLRRESQE